MNPHLMGYLITVPLILLMIWLRVRRNFGPQKVQRARMTTRLVALIAALLLIAFTSLRSTNLLEGLLGGVVIGGAFGLWGIQLTRFERNAQGADLYIPNPWIGGAITGLLVARIVWRFLVLNTEINTHMVQAGTPPPAVGNSALTQLVLGLTLGYYLCYYAGLLVHHRRFEQAQAAAQT